MQLVKCLDDLSLPRASGMSDLPTYKPKLFTGVELYCTKIGGDRPDMTIAVFWATHNKRKVTDKYSKENDLTHLLVVMPEFSKEPNVYHVHVYEF